MTFKIKSFDLFNKTNRKIVSLNINISVNFKLFGFSNGMKSVSEFRPFSFIIPYPRI